MSDNIVEITESSNYSIVIDTSLIENENNIEIQLSIPNAVDVINNTTVLVGDLPHGYPIDWTVGNLPISRVSGLYISGGSGINVVSDSGNYTISLSDPTIYSSDIVDFDSAVSGLLPVKNISAGSGIGIEATSGNFTVSVTGTFGLTGEQVDNRVKNLLSAGSYINLNYNNPFDNITINVTGLQPSGNYSLVGHTHTSLNITDFDNAVKTIALQKSTDSYIIAIPGDNLISKYAAAKLLTPNGNPLSSNNRAVLIIMPGTYSLSAELTINAEFVDILGLGSMKLDRGCVTAVTLLNNTINVTANDVRVKGISVGSQNFKVGNNLPLQVIEDCIGGIDSFGRNQILSGYFINCVGGLNSFAAYGTASGSFINCQGSLSSFGGHIGGIASGYFVNCIGGLYSFGGSGGTASGSFINCTGGSFSFGGFGTASGYFKNCVSSSLSFGSYGTLSGKCDNCISDSNSFGYSGTMSGILLGCQLKVGTFISPTGSGQIRLCIDGNYDVINADAP